MKNLVKNENVPRTCVEIITIDKIPNMKLRPYQEENPAGKQSVSIRNFAKSTLAKIAHHSKSPFVKIILAKSSIVKVANSKSSFVKSGLARRSVHQPYSDWDAD